MKQPLILQVNDRDTIKLARAWLFLGIAALLASGVFSILLVLSRTPFIQPYIPFKDFFHTAIVVHVDLSVLIWFTAFAANLWTLSCKKVITIDWLAYYFALAGTLLLAVTPFIMDGHPLMNNYIPVLQTPLFYIALGLYGFAILLRVARSLSEPVYNPIDVISRTNGHQLEKSLHLGLYLAALTTLVALVAFFYSWLDLPTSLPGLAYFEILFWGSGHILQFTHMLMMFVVWLLLVADQRELPIRVSRFFPLLFVILFIPVGFSVLPYFQYELVSAELRQSFTDLMKFGGLTALPLGAVIGYFLICSIGQKTSSAHLRAVLWSSLILFAAGGILGFMIAGANVVIPAHYHGSIVGITISFMGCSYLLLPIFGYPLSGKALKWARIQPIVYASGQMMHITGLAWSGGYGVKRKTAGDAQGLENLPEIAAMGIMGLGGSVAVVGGFLFILVCYWAIAKK